MGLKEQIDGYTSRVDSIAAEFRSELGTLNDKLTAAAAPQPVDPDVQASLDTLGSHLSSLEGVEQPTVPTDSTPEVTTPPTVVPASDPAISPTATVATDSPGEPTSQGVVVTPTGDPVPASQLPPETPTVPTASVDSGTVAPEATVTAAGDVTDQTTPVVPVSTPDAPPTATDTTSAGATVGDSTTTDATGTPQSGTPATEVTPEQNV